MTSPNPEADRSFLTDQEVPRVDRLEIERLPRGARSDRWLALAQDALGETISAPVSVLRGAQDGSVLGITAALHGDELNGVAGLQRLLAAIDPRELKGSLVAVLVTNVPGFQAGIRRYVDGNDLNHIMPGDAQGKESDRYAHALVTRLLDHFDHHIDLHGASRGRINSLYVRADLNDTASARMALCQDADILLHAPTSETSLRGSALARGMPSVTVELGDPGVWQPRMIQRATKGLLATMRGLGMLDEQAKDEAGVEAGTEANTQPMVICARSSWLRTDQGGLIEVLPALCERVEQGQEIARRYDVFGHLLERFQAPEAGIVVGRAVSPLAPSGARFLHLGIEAGASDRFVGLAANTDDSTKAGKESGAEARPHAPPAQRGSSDHG